MKGSNPLQPALKHLERLFEFIIRVMSLLAEVKVEVSFAPWVVRGWGQL